MGKVRFFSQPIKTVKKKEDEKIFDEVMAHGVFISIQHHPTIASISWKS
jgi:hypothetical protein